MKRLAICFIVFVFVFSSFPVFASFNSNSKIDPVFFDQVLQVNRRIPVIIELNNDPVVVYSSKIFDSNNYFQSSRTFNFDDLDTTYESKLINSQNDFLSWLDNNNIDYKFKFRCTNVINSLSIDIIPENLTKLINNPQVKYIHDDSIVFNPTRAIASLTTGAKNVWNGTNTTKATGKKMLIGIIDTGLDTKHPEFSEKGKVKGGYDFADGDGDYSVSTSDPSLTHGTHVAGIAGGSGSKEYQKGMAYDASFMIYKVFSAKRQGATNIIPAIDRSVADRCNVINMSLGSPGANSAKGSGTYYTAIRNATKAGVVVVAAAGNDGSRGNAQAWPAHIPGIVEETICVAASDDRTNQVIKIITPRTDKSFITAIKVAFTQPFTKEMNSMEVIDCGYGSTSDFSGININNKIALVQRGAPKDGGSTITFRVKVDNAQSAGAKGIIIYNNEPNAIISPTIFNAGEDPNIKQLIPTASITKEDGELILSLIDQDIRIGFDENGGVSIAEFSSMGPTADSVLKPEISAPGKSIYSSVPGGYAIYDGTSMACPAITGLVALLVEVHPDWSVGDIKSALMNTSSVLTNPFNGKPITFLLQGAGEARVDKAMSTPAVISPQSVILQDAGKNDSFTQEFTIKGIDKKSNEFKLSSQIFIDKTEIVPFKIELNTATIKVNLGTSQKIVAKFIIDSVNFTKSKYEGIIKIGDLHIPFLVYKESSSKLEDIVSNVRIDPKELSFNKDNEDKDINISFSFNSGNHIKYQDILNYNSNNGNIYISIVDKSGEQWGDIAVLSNYLVGDYTFKWNGKDNYGKYILPKGEFYIQFYGEDRNYPNSSTPTITRVKSSKDLISVVESVVPGPTPLILAANKIIEQKQEFYLDFYLPSVKNLNGISFILQYDSKKLIYKSIAEGTFLYSDGSDVKVDADFDDDVGIAHIKILRDNTNGLDGERVKMLSIKFKSISTGNIKFQCSSCFVLLENNEKIKAVPIYPKVNISKTDFLLTDLNGDSLVDEYDQTIFTTAFGTKSDEKEYREDCDFNQDKVVDVIDLMILSSEFGKKL